MRTLSHVRVVRAALIGALGFMGVAFTPTPVFAQIAESGILADSDLVLLEEAGSGAYEHYSITLSAHDGTIVLTTNKDGVVARFTVSSADALALWHTVLESGIETLPTAPAADTAPDSSQFTVKYRVQQTAGEFSAVGVDTLPETRYRTIVRAILSLASRYAGTRG